MRLLLPLLLIADGAAAQIAPVRSVPGVAPAPRIGPFVAAPSARPGATAETRDVARRIAQGRRAGQLSRREARDLRREAGVVDAAAARYAVGGLSDSERRELAVRGQVLRDEVIARRSGVGRAAPPADQRGR